MFRFLCALLFCLPVVFADDIIRIARHHNSAAQTPHVLTQLLVRSAKFSRRDNGDGCIDGWSVCPDFPNLCAVDGWHCCNDISSCQDGWNCYGVNQCCPPNANTCGGKVCCYPGQVCCYDHFGGCCPSESSCSEDSNTCSFNARGRGGSSSLGAAVL